MADRYWVGGTGSWDNSVGAKWAATSGGVGGQSVPLSTDNVFFDAASGTAPYTVTVGATNKPCANLSFAGFTGTYAQSGLNTNIYEGVTLPNSTGTITGGGTWVFVGTGSFNIVSNNYILPLNFNFNSVGGVWTTTDNLSITGAITLVTGSLVAGASITTGGTFTFTAGTVNFGSYTHTMNIFSSANANIRTINFGTATVNIAGNATTVWNTSTITNLTISGTAPTVNFIYSGSTGTRVISMGVLSEANSISVNITAGSDAITLSGASFKSLNFTGYSGACPLGNNIIYKDLTLSATQTIATSGTLTFSGTSVTQTITTNGITISTATLTINSATTTVQNVGALTTTGALTVTAGTLNINANLTIGSTSVFTFTAGILTANNGANITSGTFVSSSTNTRTLNMGSGTWTLGSTGIVWNINAANLTLNAQQSRILINNTASPTVANSFSGGSGFTYYTLEYARGAATANFNIVSSGTFANFIDNTSTAAHNIVFTSGGTYQFHRFNVRGASTAARISILRSATTIATLVKLGQGVVCNSDYLTVNATLSYTPSTGVWYAGANSTGAPAGGWIAGNAPSSQSLLGAGGVG